MDFFCLLRTGEELLNSILVFGKFLLAEDANDLDWESEFQDLDDSTPNNVLKGASTLRHSGLSSNRCQM
ncbi:hypothetical protein V8E54_010194 [Elaphomyces granulatus]|jgi:hypothetical protein